MKVLIERKEKTSFVNKEGQTKEKLETVRKIISEEQLKGVKALDISVKPEFKWKVVHEFKEGEKLTKEPKKTEPKKADSPELIQARKDYEEKFNKKPNHLMKLETLIEKVKKYDTDLQVARELYLKTFGSEPGSLLKTENILKEIKEKKDK